MPYPTEIDQLTATGGTLDAAPHSQLHDELRTAIVAIEQELATSPSGNFASVRARLDFLTTRLGIADGEVTRQKLAAAAVGHTKIDPAIWNPLYDPWTAYTHNAANISAGVGYVRAYYKRIGTTCRVHVDIKFGAGSALTGPPSFGIPYVPVSPIVSGSATFVRFGQTPLGAVSYATKAAARLYVLWPGTPSGHWEAGVEPSQGTDGDEVAIDIEFEVGAPQVGSLG